MLHTIPSHGVPIVSSIHTNVPEYARITVTRLLGRLLGDGLAYRAASDALALPRRVGARLERRLDRHLAHVTLVPGDERGAATIGRWRTPILRRGLDHAMFAPERRDRAWFAARFGLPAGVPIAMYAGKLNAGKNVPLLIPVIERVAASGTPVHLFCAGAGDERAELEARLGRLVTCSGPLPQDELARAYASADLFLFPSVIDEFGNAALEALASGLPALLAAGSGVAQRVADCKAATVVAGDDPAAWAATAAALLADTRRRAILGRQARDYAVARIPTWAAVLTQDLLPAWRRAAAEGK